MRGGSDGGGPTPPLGGGTGAERAGPEREREREAEREGLLGEPRGTPTPRADWRIRRMQRRVFYFEPVRRGKTRRAEAKFPPILGGSQRGSVYVDSGTRALVMSLLRYAVSFDKPPNVLCLLGFKTVCFLFSLCFFPFFSLT